MIGQEEESGITMMNNKKTMGLQQAESVRRTRKWRGKSKITSRELKTDTSVNPSVAARDIQSYFASRESGN